MSLEQPINTIEDVLEKTQEFDLSYFDVPEKLHELNSDTKEGDKMWRLPDSNEIINIAKESGALINDVFSQADEKDKWHYTDSKKGKRDTPDNFKTGTKKVIFVR